MESTAYTCRSDRAAMWLGGGERRLRGVTCRWHRRVSLVRGVKTCGNSAAAVATPSTLPLLALSQCMAYFLPPFER